MQKDYVDFLNDYLFCRKLVTNFVSKSHNVDAVDWNKYKISNW